MQIFSSSAIVKTYAPAPHNPTLITPQRPDNHAITPDMHMTDSSQSSTPLSDAILNVKDVHFTYPQTTSPVLTDISLSLRTNRICALIGPNAAGKSTLIKLMLGQLSPTQGSITLGSHSVSSLPPIDRAKHICYVPQRGSLSFAYTVRQVVEMGRFALGKSEAAVNWALELCDLKPQENKIYAELSGGQQQRVTIARALAQSYTDPASSPSQNPASKLKVFLLDEPGSNLDLWHVQQMMNVLKERADAGFAVLVVLHDLNLAARYADDVILLNQGNLVAAGPWDTVLQKHILEDVYRVHLHQVHSEHTNRPMFFVD
ncbi:ABC transporter ATP-binding protein [Planctomycetota bacterium]|nr:ABC transporter ATP-binding protein [Planctomycetota bacterium]